MQPYYQKDDITLYHGDLRDVLPEAIQPSAVDFVVTDPPYGLGFMEKDWDFDVPGPAYWKTIASVCKPGALLLAFGGTRTWHRLVGAIEDAQWEIRDCLMWLYGQGFPKSLDISKALDKVAGAEREIVGRRTQPDIRGDSYQNRQRHGKAGNVEILDTVPATELAKRWNGWGSSLKPAWEPIVLAMKPLDGTFAQNAQRHGVAGMNIDACRIPCDYAAEYGENWLASGKGKAGPWHATEYEETRSVAERVSPLGRWPANLLLEHHPECRQVGTTTLRGDPRGNCAGRRPGGFGNVGADSGDGEPNARVYGNEVVAVLVAAALVAVAITTSVWLTREPLTAAPAVQPPARIAPEPTPAPRPPAQPTTMPTVLEVPIEVEIADLAPAPVNAPMVREPEKPAVKPAEPQSERQPQFSYQPRRWGLFRRR